MVGPFARLRPGRGWTRRADRQLRRGQERGTRRGRQGQPSDLSGRRTRSARREHRRRHHHLQLRRLRKHRTEIGAGAFIGSNTALVAPVTVGDGAIVGAGSTMSPSDVDADAMAVGARRAEDRPGAAAKRKRNRGARSP